jgi:hypothetical protein
VKAIISFLFLVVGASLARCEVFTGEKLNVPFTVHGRLGNYMGYAQMRIWVVGSTRMLGVEGETDASKKIASLFPEGGFCDHWVYGDFLVEPLAPDIKGHKRPIRILGVRNVVVERMSDKAIILTKREL